ncbi:RNI-like protein [Hypoxylon sp. NC0597]|nr:RNI-like protein [Hypoxylon sp. NC0597]
MQRNIRGPQSALTDYLASQNISATRIRAEHEARRAAAASEAANSATTTQGAQEEDGQDGQDGQGEEAGPSSAVTAHQTLERKRKAQAEAIEKIKKSKAFKRRKQVRNPPEDDDLALALFEEAASKSVPGQIENCEECGKRFTVTAYTRAGPKGGLLCPQCASKLVNEEKAAKNNKNGKKAAAGPASRGRRKMQSCLLDGHIGVKSLVTLCVETLAKNIHLADSLGDLPPIALDRIARQLSKRRLLDPKTLQLFLQPQTEDIALYDAARIGQDDYIKMFGVCSKLKNLKVRSAIQFRDKVMEYLIGRNLALESISLSGANLLTKDSWKKFLEAKGKALKGLRVYFTDRYFDDELVGSLKDWCPDLVTLKICHNQQVSDKGVEQIAHLDNLERLGLHLVTPTSTMPYVHIIEKIGKNLRTFSVRTVSNVDDRLLDALHDHCTHLTKLRITDSEVMTDAGFARLFKEWKNRSLTCLDLEKCRHIDSAKPRDNPHMVGLCSNGFKALMAHSGKSLQKLNLHACRHISQEAFEEVFSPVNIYPNLVDLELSFCEEVTDFIVGSIFRCCPKLWRLNVFGCMKLKEVRVPKGKILVGMPNAIGMVIEGTED